MKFMAKRLLLLYIFFPLVVLSQNDSIVSGKIVSESSLLEGIHVINLSKRNGAVTDSRGHFQIKAKVSDTLQFSAVNLKATRHVLKASDFSNDLLLIKMESLITELEEVAIINYKNINAVALGIVPANQKTYTPAERKLKTASEFKPESTFYFGGTTGVSLSFDAILNAISGRTTMLKNELVVERKELLQAKTSDYFERKYFIETLKIPDEFVDGFLFYIVENEKFVNAMKDKNKTMATFVLSELAVEYLKLKELETSNKNANEN